VGFSFGFPVDERIQRIVDLIPDQCWCPALESDGQIRDGAWVARPTVLVDLSACAAGDAAVPARNRRVSAGWTVYPGRRRSMEEVSHGQPAADRRGRQPVQ